MEALCVDSSGRLGLELSVVVGLVPVGRDVADRGVEALVVEPVDPFSSAEFDVGEAVPGLAQFDQLSLVEADLGFHERVVQSIADGADRGVDAGLGEVRGEREGRVWTARVRVMNQPLSSGSSGAVAAGHEAMPRASRTSLARLLVAADQPTIARENTSTTNAT